MGFSGSLVWRENATTNKTLRTISKLRFWIIQKQKTITLFKSVWIDQLPVLLLSVKVLYFLGSTVPLVTSQFLNSWPVSSTSLPSKISNSSRLPLMKGIFLNSCKKLRTSKANTIILFFYIGLIWSCKIQYKKQSGTLPTSLSIEQIVRKVLTFFMYFNSFATGIRSPAER